MEKLYRKCAQKLVTDPFLILADNPKQLLHARISFTNQIFGKRIM